MENQNFSIKGRVTAKRYKSGTVQKVREILSQYNLETAKKLIPILLADNFLGIGAQNNNLVVSSSNRGRNLIAQHLGDYADGGVRDNYPLAITYAELGSGTTPPANSDTELDTAVDRTATSLAQVVDNVVTLNFFWADGDLANGTYNEFGTFTGGTGTLGSGQLFNHALLSPGYVKASGEDTSFEVEFTIN